MIFTLKWEKTTCFCVLYKSIRWWWLLFLTNKAALFQLSFLKALGVRALFFILIFKQNQKHIKRNRECFIILSFVSWALEDIIAHEHRRQFINLKLTETNNKKRTRLNFQNTVSCNHFSKEKKNTLILNSTSLYVSFTRLRLDLFALIRQKEYLHSLWQISRHPICYHKLLGDFSM